MLVVIIVAALARGIKHPIDHNPCGQSQKQPKHIRTQTASSAKLSQALTPRPNTDAALFIVIVMHQHVTAAIFPLSANSNMNTVHSLQDCHLPAIAHCMQIPPRSTKMHRHFLQFFCINGCISTGD
jgi:hypothetical protein